MDRSEKSAIQGSERVPVKGGRVAGAVADEETIDVTVRVRATSDGLAARGADAVPMTRAELAQRHSASPEDLRAIEAFAHAHGLTVLDASPHERAVRLRGPARAMQDAFGVLLERVEHPRGGTFRQRTGPVRVPGHLAEIVTGVFGLDDRPQAHPQLRFRSRTAGASSPTAAATQFPGTFTPPQIAQVYDFPGEMDGQGQTIALIELGGGYRTTDLDEYAAGLGLPPFQVVAISVDGGQNAPGVDPGSDGEVALDIEVAAGVAPRATIAVYFAPNSDRGFIDALSAAVHDSQRAPGVISISWGHAEDSWTLQARTAFDEVLQEAAAIGVPVFVAAGDNGASDDEPGDHVDYPASSPYAIGCGGTRLAAAQSVRSAETVWNDLDQQGGATGGGFSAIYSAPAFQAPSIGGQSMRGVPDLAANADPDTGYLVRLGGTDEVIGGTSAVAPLLAGLTALCNQQAGHGPGALLSKLYAAGSPSSAYFDVVQGNNGGFNAGPGWDACSGLGVPSGTAFAAAGWGVAATPPA